MEDKIKYEFDEMIVKKLLTIIGLVYKINCETDYALFCNFSGHTNQIDVRVNEDKEDGEQIGNSHAIYLNPFKSELVEDGEAGKEKIYTRLDSLITNLEKLLPKPVSIEL